VKRWLVAAGLFLAGVAPSAWAQGNLASLGVDATVVNPGMTINTLNNLAFGTVIKGVATTILPTAAAAGEWEVIGSNNARVTITFTLPSVLTNIQALPGSTIPVSFSSTSAIWRRNVNSPTGGGANTFDPNVGTTGRFGPTPNPVIYLWLGGTVTPPVTAKPGIYTANVIVTLVYT
jgi:hypothetical protein